MFGEVESLSSPSFALPEDTRMLRSDAGPHRRARHPQLPPAAPAPPSGRGRCRGHPADGPGQPALCDRQPEHAGLDHAQCLPLRLRGDLGAGGAVRSAELDASLDPSRDHRRAPAFACLGLYGGGRARGRDGRALGAGDRRSRPAPWRRQSAPGPRSRRSSAARCFGRERGRRARWQGHHGADPRGQIGRRGPRLRRLAAERRKRRSAS